MKKQFWTFKRADSKRFTAALGRERKQVKLPESITTKTQADRYTRDNFDALMSGAVSSKPRSKEPRVAELIDKWIALRKSDKKFASSTFKDASGMLRKWVATTSGKVSLGSKTIADLDAPLLRAWLRDLRDAKVGKSLNRTIAPYTVRNVVAALAWFLDDVEGEGWAILRAGNPARSKAVRAELPDMEPRAGKSQKLRIKSVADAQRLLDCEAIPLQRRARYLLDMTAGLRDGEVAGLTIADVSANEVRVYKSLQLRTREGGTRIGKTKTRGSVRTVPLHPAASAAICEWLSDGWDKLTGRAHRSTDPVFCNASGKPHRPRSAELFRADLEAAGLPSQVDGHPLTFHALRRSFSSWLAATGVPEEVRRALLGHAAQGAEEGHYTEQSAETLAAAVGKIGLVWKPCAERGGKRM